MVAANEDEKPTIKLLALVIAALLAGTGGSLGFRVIDNPRPDPFTGSDGRQLEARIERKLEILEAKLRKHEENAEAWKFKIQSNKDRLDYHMGKHP